MNYPRQQRGDTKPTRLRELARLRSLHLQPLSPSSKSGKQVKEDMFTFDETNDKPYNPVDVDDVSICMSPSHLAVETRLPEPSPRSSVVENRHDPPITSPRQMAFPLSPSQGTKTILDSPRMKNLRKQHQQRSGCAAVESANASLRRAQHHRRCASNSRARATEERGDVETTPKDVSSPKTAAVRHRSTGRSLIVNRRSFAAPKPGAAGSGLLRARRYRRSLPSSNEQGNESAVAPTPKVSNATVCSRPLSKSPAKPANECNVQMSIELNDSDIFTDFHLVMMAASSDDSSIATASSWGSKSSLSCRRQKLMGRKFKSISKSKPSHHNAIAKLVAQKKKNVHIPISQLCQCIVPIQTIARVFLAKLAAERRMDNIILMQSIIRRWKCQRYLSSCRFMALQMQACYRGCIAREEAIVLRAQSFVATQLQACYRGSSARSLMRYESYCATKIQAVWRSYWQYLIYGDALEGTVLIQSVVRMWRQRKMFLFVQNARRQLEEQMQAAREEAASVKMQTFWRGASQRVNYCNTVIDAVIVQSVIRRWSAIRIVNKMLVEFRAAIKIQSVARGRFIREDYVRVLSAAVIIQAAIRRGQAVQKLENLRVEKHARETASASKIAAQWRKFSTRSKFFNTLIDIIICQSTVRRFIALKQADFLRQEQEEVRRACAALIQRLWRTSRFREVQSNMIRLQQMEDAAATKIETAWRRFICEEDYRLTVIDTIICQRAVRRFFARRRQERIECASVTVIQAIWRRYSCKKAYNRLINDLMEAEAATLIQSRWRSFNCSRTYMMLLGDVIICQSIVRRRVACNKANEARIERNHTETMVQLLSNMEHLKVIENMSTILITSVLRRWVCESNYNKAKSAVVTCQSVVRRFLVRKQRAIEMDRAAILCQSVIRRRLAIVRVTTMRHDILQAMIVEKIRLESIAQEAAATIIAKVWRRKMCENQLEVKAAAVTQIASCWRGYVARMVCVDILIGVILFQSHFRRRMALKQTESLRQKLLEDSATKIQAAWRGFAASIRYTWSIYDVVLVQSLVRRWLARRYIHEALEEKYRKEMAAATKIQAQWRGFSDFRDYMILLGDVILCQSVVRRHFASKRTNVRRQEWQQAEHVLQIMYNMNQLGAIEHSSATKIARTWKEFRKTKLARMVSAWRNSCAQSRMSYS